MDVVKVTGRSVFIMNKQLVEVLIDRHALVSRWGSGPELGLGCGSGHGGGDGYGCGDGDFGNGYGYGDGYGYINGGGDGGYE